jgi:hypothetical protein
MPCPYKNRTEAAGLLVNLLQPYSSGRDGLILALRAGACPSPTRSQ